MPHSERSDLRGRRPPAPNTILPALPGGQSSAQILILCLIALGAFALYAGAVQFVIFHDDLFNVRAIGGRTVLDVFDIRPFGHRDYRPLMSVPWLLVRDWFGWFVPGLLHMWNVYVHVLSTVLVGVIALRVGRWVGLRGALFPALASLIFAVFPFSYQGILWAGALGHPLMTLCGLAGIYAYLLAREQPRRRGLLLALSALLLLCACLSHETGFLFGALIVLVEFARARVVRQPFWRGAILLCALMAAYPVVYELFIKTVWNTNSFGRSKGFGDVVNNVIYYTQAFTSWLLIFLRDRVIDTGAPALAVVGLFVLTVGGALVIMRKARARVNVLPLGLLGLGWWAIALLPSALYLEQSYVSGSPRMMYPLAAGVAWFWAALLAGVIVTARRPVLTLALLALVAVLSARFVLYIQDRSAETLRFSHAVRFIEGDLERRGAGARALLINLPAWNAPTRPGFVYGAEGTMFFLDANGPVADLLSYARGITFTAVNHARHDISLTQGEQYTYGPAGDVVDDNALRAGVLGSDAVYRFDFDPPGLRVRRLAVLSASAPAAAPLATLTAGQSRAAIAGASAVACDGRIEATLTWTGIAGIDQPVGVFVHGLNAAGEQVAVADRDLVDGYLPLEQVPAGLTLTETREIKRPDAGPLPVELRLGLYSRIDGKRFTALRVDGTAWPGDEVAVPVQTGAGQCLATSH
jgi:hypothetical protein